jgi:hypothetical protein
MRILFRNLHYFFVVLICSTQACAQHADSTQAAKSEVKTPINWAKVVKTPVILIAAGLLTTKHADINFMNKYEVHEERNEMMPNFRTHFDDYLQYAPIAIVYGLNAAGIRGEHSIGMQTKLLIKSELIMVAMVCPLKKLTAVPRPDSGEPNSFPSGHTAQAFAAATFMHKEYGKTNPMYSVLAYTTATGVGVLRVLNNRHWVSDVLAGAGIGILATNIAYLTVKDKPHKRHPNRDIVMAPSYGNRTLALSMVIGLH